MGDIKQTARLRAMRRLSKIHSKEFAMLLDEEFVAVGLPPVQRRGQRKVGTRSCYNVCKGKHPECAQANRDYAREMDRLYRQGIKMIDITKVD